MSVDLIGAFNAATTDVEALAAINTYADELELSAASLAALEALPDGGGREKAIGLGVNEIKTLFGEFETVTEIKTAVEKQIAVEHAKHQFITALDGATTPEAMAAAIKATVLQVNTDRAALIAEWDAIEGNAALDLRVEALKADTYTTALAEIVKHLDAAAYMAELGKLVLEARGNLPGGQFFGVVKIADALKNADAEIDAAHDASISGTSTGSLAEDGSQSTIGGTLSVTDEDWGENVFQAVASADLEKEYGTFTFNETTGVWSFTIDNTAAQSLKKDQTVQQTLTVKSADGTASQIITVTVTGTNDTPVAASTGNDFSGSEDTVITGSLPAGTDVDAGDSKNYELVAPVAGLTLKADGTFSYAPPADFNGLVEFKYRVVDSAGAKSEAQTFKLTVNAVNDAPRDILLSNAAVLENSATGTEIGKLTASDPEGGDLTFTLLDNAGGRFVIDSNGSLRVANDYALDFEQATSHTIKVQVKDSAGATYEESFTVSVTDDTNEKVIGTATADVITGGAGKDVFNGGLGNDELAGGLGNDTLTGGKGKDVFVFDSKLGTSSTDRKVNFDKITDFSVKDDSIYLDNAIFKKLGSGTEAKPKQLSKSFFTIGNKANDKNDYLIYNDKTGVLSYDADGSGKGKAIEIAQLSKKLAMTYKDFFVI